MDSLFPESYEASRARFLRDAELLRARWASSRLEHYPLKKFPDLSIDWLWAEPDTKRTLVIVSTGQHGIEGYVGSAMLKLFMEDFASRIDTSHTGLLLVHAINPWGMKHYRKVNENGVDLNRNFILDGSFDPATNPDFLSLQWLLAPSYSVGLFGIESFRFAARVVRALLTHGAESITRAALLGQYSSGKFMYYGGSEHEEQTVLMISLLSEALQKYQNVIHLDMHTGYGPRYQMSLTLSPPERQTSAELAAKFKYPLVLKAEGEEFYRIHGDMTAGLYVMRNTEFPERHVFATAFEFGTYGESLLQRIRSLRTMVFESQLYWHGTKIRHAENKIHRDFSELYFPAEAKWREKAVFDCRQAFDGILTAYDLW